ncbi:unnamed protein product, partial [Choristocarpus tenellus]
VSSLSLEKDVGTTEVVGWESLRGVRRELFHSPVDVLASPSCSPSPIPYPRCSPCPSPKPRRGFRYTHRQDQIQGQEEGLQGKEEESLESRVRGKHEDQGHDRGEGKGDRLRGQRSEVGGEGVQKGLKTRWEKENVCSNAKAEENSTFGSIATTGKGPYWSAVEEKIYTSRFSNDDNNGDKSRGGDEASAAGRPVSMRGNSSALTGATISARVRHRVTMPQGQTQGQGDITGRIRRCNTLRI